MSRASDTTIDRPCASVPTTIRRFPLSVMLPTRYRRLFPGADGRRPPGTGTVAQNHAPVEMAICIWSTVSRLPITPVAGTPGLFWSAVDSIGTTGTGGTILGATDMPDLIITPAVTAGRPYHTWPLATRVVGFRLAAFRSSSTSKEEKRGASLNVAGGFLPAA